MDREQAVSSNAGNQSEVMDRDPAVSSNAGNQSEVMDMDPAVSSNAGNQSGISETKSKDQTVSLSTDVADKKLKSKDNKTAKARVTESKMAESQSNSDSENRTAETQSKSKKEPIYQNLLEILDNGDTNPANQTASVVSMDIPCAAGTSSGKQRARNSSEPSSVLKDQIQHISDPTPTKSPSLREKKPLRLKIPPFSQAQTSFTPPSKEYSASQPPSATPFEEYSAAARFTSPRSSNLKHSESEPTLSRIHSGSPRPSTSGTSRRPLPRDPGVPGSANPTVNSAVRQYLYAHQELMDDEDLSFLRLRFLEGFRDRFNDFEEFIDNWDWTDMDRVEGILNHMIAEDLLEDPKVPVLNSFNKGIECVTECEICLDTVKLFKRSCCRFAACDECLKRYLEVRINDGMLRITCIGSCDVAMSRDEILARVPSNIKDKYYKFLVNANKDPKVKTCPNCSYIHELTQGKLDEQTKYGLLVACPETDCQLNWCFLCQAPWHQGIKCKDFNRGDKLVSQWAREKHYGNINAQKCPRCKIFIERKGGCDHMTCSKCNKSFCYRCGGRYIDLKFFGNHQSRYSPLGCKYNFEPDHPVLRRTVRGSVLGAKLLCGVGLVCLGVAAVGVLVGTSVIILPAFGGFKYYKYRKFKKRLKRQQELIRTRSKNAMIEFHRERLDGDFVDPRLIREHNCGFWNPPGSLAQDHYEGVEDLQGDNFYIGVQTGNSQQVDVTVHNPYQTDSGLNPDEETLSSEIRMNISDELGQVTVTTAEIQHNSTGGEGSEAEIVLHVKTSYPKGAEKEGRLCDNNSTRSRYVDASTSTASTLCRLEPSKDKSKGEASKDKDKVKGEVSKDKDKSKGDGSKDKVKTEVENKFDLAESSRAPTAKFCTSHSLDSKPKTAVVHRRAHSTGSLKKPVRKHDFGSLSMKNKKSIGSPQTDSSLPFPDHGHCEGLNSNTPALSKLSNDTDDVSESEALNQSGCFLKLFSKKLNTLQNQVEREKHLVHKTTDTTLDNLKTGGVDAMRNSGDNDSSEQDSYPDVSPVTEDFVGVISQESRTTSF